MWDFGDGNTSTMQNDYHVYTSGGMYNVCLIATDACGMADTICQQVTILTTSMNDISATGFTVYPNPAADVISLQLANTVQDATIEILDVSGKKMMSHSSHSGKQMTVDVSSLSQGVYFIRMNAAGCIHTGYFIKQ
jgi:PKD repeat protein